jgi:hypothetical protein
MGTTGSILVKFLFLVNSTEICRENLNVLNLTYTADVRHEDLYNFCAISLNDNWVLSYSKYDFY